MWGESFSRMGLPSKFVAFDSRNTVKIAIKADDLIQVQAFHENRVIGVRKRKAQVYIPGKDLSKMLLTRQNDPG